MAIIILTGRQNNFILVLENKGFLFSWNNRWKITGKSLLHYPSKGAPVKGVLDARIDSNSLRWLKKILFVYSTFYHTATMYFIYSGYNYVKSEGIVSMTLYGFRYVCALATQYNQTVNSRPL